MPRSLHRTSPADRTSESCAGRAYRSGGPPSLGMKQSCLSSTQEGHMHPLKRDTQSCSAATCRLGIIQMSRCRPLADRTNQCCRGTPFPSRAACPKGTRTMCQSTVQQMGHRHQRLDGTQFRSRVVCRRDIWCRSRCRAPAHRTVQQHRGKHTCWGARRLPGMRPTFLCIVLGCRSLQRLAHTPLSSGASHRLDS